MSILDELEEFETPALRRGRKRRILPATHCNNGHLITPENTCYFKSKGRVFPRCRQCRELTNRKAYLKTKSKRAEKRLRSQLEKAEMKVRNLRALIEKRERK